VKKASPLAGSRTPSWRRPAEGLPIEVEWCQAMRGAAGFDPGQPPTAEHRAAIRRAALPAAWGT
jgi:hypothetical protein